jgi:hypothetical protein
MPAALMARLSRGKQGPDAGPPGFKYFPPILLSIPMALHTT